MRKKRRIFVDKKFFCTKGIAQKKRTPYISYKQNAMNQPATFNETWAVSNQEVYDIPGFTMISRINSHQSTPKARGSCIFIKSNSLNRSSSNYATHSRLSEDNTNRSSVSISIAIIQDIPYCSRYASPICTSALILQSLRYVTSHNYMYILIAGDSNIIFNEESSKKQIPCNLWHPIVYSVRFLLIPSLQLMMASYTRL
jgi:hypothetical protein